MQLAEKHLSHCAAFFQIFGHQYFSVNTLSEKTLSQSPSRWYTFYFFFIFVLMTGQMIVFATFAFSDDLQVQLSSKTILTYVVQHSMYIGLIVIICVSLIQSFTTTLLYKKFFLNCMKITKNCFEDFDLRINNHGVRTFVYKFFISIVSFFVASQTLLYYYETHFGESKVLGKNLFGTIPLIFLSSTAIKFIFQVKLVNYHMETILNILPKIMQSRIKIVDSLTFYAKPIKPMKSAELSMKIRNIRRMYNIVCENAEIINRSMGATLLAIVIVLVIAITASGYRLFLAMLGKVPEAKLGGKSRNKRKLQDLKFCAWFRRSLFIGPCLWIFVCHRVHSHINSKTRK